MTPARVIAIALALSAFLFLPAAGRASVADLRDHARIVAPSSVADALDAAAALARRNPRAKLRVPIVHLAPAGAGALPRAATLLDNWLQADLRQIRGEKNTKLQARQLHDLASSLRDSARLGGSRAAPQFDPGTEAARILAQRSYQVESSGAAPAPHESLWERFLSWFGRMLSRVFGGIFETAASAPLVGQILAMLFLLALLGAAAYGISLLVQAFAGRRRSGSSDEGHVLTGPPDPQDLYERGLAAAAEGRYAAAITLLFQASLASFDRAGQLEYDPTRTAGEYRHAVRRTLAAASPSFDALASAFTLAAYAQARIAESDFAAANEAFCSLRPLLAP